MSFLDITPFLSFVEDVYASVPSEITTLGHEIFDVITSIDEFQLKILRVLILILCLNLFFIWITWSKYGEKITERFMKPASSKSLEELKREARELKLPKEHTPRI